MAESIGSDKVLMRESVIESVLRIYIVSIPNELCFGVHEFLLFLQNRGVLRRNLN